MFNSELLDVVMGDDVAARRFICEQDFKYFFVYYMGEYVKYSFAPFHYDIFEALGQLNVSGETKTLREVAVVAFRESAKTSIYKAYALWSILFKKYNYIIVDSYEKSNSETFLFDIIVQLQTNLKILHDFGQQYNIRQEGGEWKETTQKRVSNFVTNNGIRVEAASTQESLRGRLHKSNRIGLIIADDFENNKTKDSERVTQKVIEHFQEALAGMDSNGAVMYCANYITDRGSVQWIMNRAATDEKIKLFNIPLLEGGLKDGKLMWDAKYCYTKQQALETGKVSIEEIEQKLSPSVFQVEMLNNPYAAGQNIFKKEWFQEKDMQYVKNFCLKCYITIDTATGQGKDYNAIVVNYLDHTEAWHILAFRNKHNAGELVDNLFGLYQTYKPVAIGIEKTTYTLGFMNFLQMEMRKRQQFLPIIELTHGGKKKEERIKNTLETRYANHSIFHIKGYCTELEDELLKFPLGLHDDLCDALSYQSQIVKGLTAVKINFSSVYKI